MQPPLRVIPALASAHLRHEWILTLCLVIALAAVIAPLLVLLGLKYGTIELMRDRLVEDPIFRELRPAQTREYAPDWFLEVETWPGTGFVTPTVLPLSSILHAVHPHSNDVILLDLIPTAPNDPLLLENGARIPVDGECVLTTQAARELGVNTGDWLDVRITRSRGGVTEAATTRLQVIGVLAPRAGSLSRIYAPFDFVLDVEAYKEGYGAPERGWSGDIPEPFLSFDGVILLLPEALTPIERTGLIINTGFAHITSVELDYVQQQLALSVDTDWHAYRLYVPGATVTISNMRAVQQKLRGRGSHLLPYVQGITFYTENDEALSPVGVSLTTRQANELSVQPTPWGGFDPNTLDGARLTQGLLPARVSAQQMPIRVAGVNELSFVLQGIATTDSKQTELIVPIELLGIVRTAMQRGVVYQDEQQRFVMTRGGYRGFRLYARSIDDVAGLYQRLQDQGIEVIAEVETIERIRTLDAGLQRLFWLIALLGVSGGTAVLIASLYAAVERRRRDLGILRLNGLSRRAVFFFPVVQALWIALLGLITSLAGYLALASLINYTFASDLAPGERFCTLPPSYIFMAGVSTLVLAILASLAAAWRTTRIDPAEAVREH